MTVARASQEALETLVAPDPAARLTQEALEALVAPSTQQGRVSQVAFEVLVKPTSAVVGLRGRVTQQALEVLVKGWGRGVLSQLALEVLVAENILPPPPPPGPPGPPVLVPTVHQLLTWRDAHGHTQTTEYWFDPANAEFGGDISLVAADAQALAALIDGLVHGYLETASGPYSLLGPLAYGASSLGATVSDVVDVCAATAAGEVSYLRLPTTPATATSAGLIGNLGSVPALLNVVVYWLTHCCSPSGGPLVLYLGTYRRRAPYPTRQTAKTRRPDLSGQAI